VRLLDFCPGPGVLALLAVLMATVNLVGGFVVTDRMLEMFSGKKKSSEGAAS